MKFADSSRSAVPAPWVQHVEIEIVPGLLSLPGELSLPHDPLGLVLFAHGSGSSRHSSRNRFVASQLVRAGCATLLFDLLTEEEAETRAHVFDIGLLGERVKRACVWAQAQADLTPLPLGLFGASTGAAAALVAAADPTSRIAAVVSRGGRPDLAASVLRLVRAPTLLIVGAHDPEVLELNVQARAKLTCESELVVVPDASHLFEEPGTLADVASHASRWFAWHFAHRAGQALANS